MSIAIMTGLKRKLGVALLAGTVASSVFGEPDHLPLEEFRQLRLPDVVLEKVTPVTPDTGKNPRAKAHTQVEGVIGGTIRFQLLLPEEWNGKFVMGGGGGFVGSVQNSARDSVNRGYATVGTDTGHEFQPDYMAGWALDNMEARVNFGFLAVHRTAEVAKALILQYYRAAPNRSYFLGCSRGGGQAMMEAQRYPGDFDGIVAGAPAFDWTGGAACMVQIARSLYPDPSHLDQPVLDKATLTKLAQSLLEQCDEQDGLKDGVIQDPASAHFDLAKVPDLTEPQRKAIESIYRGARDINGAHYPGFTPAAEVIPDEWIAWIVGSVPEMLAKDRVPDLSFAYSTQIFKYLIFNDPEWGYARYDFSRFPRDRRLAASYLNATDPNLTAFKQRHGKLILWHGWADPALPAEATIEYYRQALAHDPGLAGYCRLFLIPGCLHCGGGPGATEVDWLSVITDWVEHDQAPDKLIASKHNGSNLTLTRPLFPYPQSAAYNGTGDPASAASFSAKQK